MPIRSSYAQSIGQDRLSGRGQSIDVSDVRRKDLAAEAGAELIGTESGALAQDYFTAADINTVSSLLTSTLPPQSR